PTSPTLSETYTSDDGKWTFQYPAGWVINDSIANIILIATSQATADKAYTLAGYDADEASIMFGLNTINDSNNKPADHVTTFAGGIGIPLGEAAETTVSGRNGARVDGSSDVRHL